MVEILTELLSQSLGTLNSLVALKVGAAYDNDQLTSRSFLVKKFMINIGVKGITAGDEGLLFGCCSGELSVGAIKAALDAIILSKDPAETGIALRVYWETIRMIPNLALNAPLSYSVSLGGGKGIPQQVDQGWQWFIYNVSGANLQTGSTIKGSVVTYGVWL